MRWLLRRLITTGLSVYLLSLILPGFTLSGSLKDLVVISLGLILATKLINLATLGLFRWITPLFSLYLVARLSPDLAVTDWRTLILAAFLFSLSQATLRWLW